MIASREKYLRKEKMDTNKRVFIVEPLSLKRLKRRVVVRIGEAKSTYRKLNNFSIVELTFAYVNTHSIYSLFTLTCNVIYIYKKTINAVLIK